MDGWLSCKRKRSPENAASVQRDVRAKHEDQDQDEDSTELKIAILSSLHPTKSQDVLLDFLLAYDGSVEKASEALQPMSKTSPRKSTSIGYQSSLATFAGQSSVSKGKSLTRKGQTLHLFSPEDIEKHTPCSIIHNFLPAADAELLLRELLIEVPSYKTETFQMFERTVESPHTFAFYVDSLAEVQDQKDQYVYNGGILADVHQSTKEMLRASFPVREAVNKEIQRRIRDFNPDQAKLKFQSSEEWRPNTSFVNCYDGGKESVGYHSDQYTQGQIAIHLPHNSLLVMHAEMQEEWKHAIAPAQRIDPHPIAGNKRINITYRCYKDYLHPRYTPRCKCNVPCVLRCVQKQKATRGRYMWMCHANYTPGQKGCSHFEWAAFDEDGRPPWANGYKGNANIPATLEGVR
ncbi:hypothetical protein AMS68_000415 [Peltaster fructicola]|uniref:GRF-type domain-containing protein n=1 Tax=Peltaster fructicola TaxID=286661 RepID=A0A6H0XJT9_9PEZI|nr:hypothetical protein AMS68_000415 [Peltaster fructicola]